MAKDIRELYREVSQFADINVSEDEFNEMMKDPSSRKSFYDQTSQIVDMGSEDDFNGFVQSYYDAQEATIRKNAEKERAPMSAAAEPAKPVTAAPVQAQPAAAAPAQEEKSTFDMASAALMSQGGARLGNMMMDSMERNAEKRKARSEAVNEILGGLDSEVIRQRIAEANELGEGSRKEEVAKLEKRIQEMEDLRGTKDFNVYVQDAINGLKKDIERIENAPVDKYIPFGDDEAKKRYKEMTTELARREYDRNREMNTQAISSLDETIGAYKESHPDMSYDEGRNITVAERIRKRADNTANAGAIEGVDDSEALGNWAEGLSNTLFDTDILSACALFDGVRMKDVAKKLNDYNKTYEKDKDIRLEDFLTDDEIVLIDAILTNQMVEMSRANDLSKAYKMGQGTAQSLPFMVDMLITHGATSVGKRAFIRAIANSTKLSNAAGMANMAAKFLGGMEGVEYGEKGVKGLLSPQMRRILGYDGKSVVMGASETMGKAEVLNYIGKEIIATPVQTALMASSWNSIEREMMSQYLLGKHLDGTNIKAGEGMNFLDFSRLFTNAAVETGTERWGGKMIDEAGGWILKKTFPKLAGVGAWGKQPGGSALVNYIQSPFGETGEEYIGAAINYLRSFNGLYNADPEFSSNKNMREEIQDMLTTDGFMQVFGTILPMSFAGGAINMAMHYKSQLNYADSRNALSEYLQRSGATKDQAEKIMQQLESSATQEEFNEKVRQTMENMMQVNSINDTKSDAFKNLNKLITNYYNSAFVLNSSMMTLNREYENLTDEQKAQFEQETNEAIQQMAEAQKKKAEETQAKLKEDAESKARLQASAEISGYTHEDGNVYEVEVKNADGTTTTGHIVGGNVVTFEDKDGVHIEKNQSDAEVLVNINGESVRKNVHELNLIAPPVRIEDAIEAAAQVNIAANAVRSQFHEGDVVTFKHEGAEPVQMQVVSMTDEGVTLMTATTDGAQQQVFVPMVQALAQLEVTEQKEDYKPNEGEQVAFVNDEGITRTATYMGNDIYDFGDGSGNINLSQLTNNGFRMSNVQQYRITESQQAKDIAAAKAFALKHGEESYDKLNITINSLDADLASAQEEYEKAQAEVKALPDAYNEEIAKKVEAANQKLTEAKAKVDELQAQKDSYNRMRPFIPMTKEQRAEFNKAKRGSLEDDMRQEIDNLTNLLGVPVNTYDNVESVTDKQAADAIKAGKRVAGWVDKNGNVGIYIPNNASVEEVRETIYHEIIAHKGVKELLGEENFKKVMKRVWSGMSHNDQLKFARYAYNNESTAEQIKDLLGKDKIAFGRLSDEDKAKLMDDERIVQLAADEYVAYIAEEYARLDKDDNSTLAQKIRNAFEEIYQSIIDFVSNLMGSEAALTREDVLMMLRASKQNLVTEANKKRENFTAEQLNDAENISNPNPEYHNVELDDRGELVSATSPEGQSLFSIRTYDEGGRDRLAEFLNERVVIYESGNMEEGIDRATADLILEDMDKAYNNAVALIREGNYDAFDEWSYTPVRVAANGDYVYSVIKPNSEYDMNLDFSLICKKRRTLDAVINQMIDRGMIDALPAKNDDFSIARINNIIRKYGFETACRLCFVDAKRFRQAKVAEDFVQLYNGQFRKIAERFGIPIDYFDFAEVGKKPSKGALHTLTDDQVQPIIDYLKKTIATEDKQKGDAPGRSVTYKVCKHLLEHPEDRKLLMRADFMSSRGFDNVTTINPAIRSLYNSKKGSGGPKATESDTPYTNEIANADWSIREAYRVGGVRVQSFSDYVPHLFFDYLQMFAEMAANKLPAHSYTKEPLYARMFGLMGIKVNMSLVPGVDSEGVAVGLDKDGNYVWQEGETFPYEEAMRLQNTPGYRDNCGTIAVGVSDAHIRKMLADPNIRMVIPYHKSGLNQRVAVYNGIDVFTDYTSEQNTGYMEGGKRKKITAAMKASMPDYGIDLMTMDAPAAAQRYIDWCNQNNYLPKFSRFLEGEVGNFRMTEGYYKMLEDFTTMVPNMETGEMEYKPQRAVEFKLPANISEIIREGLDEDQNLEDRKAKLVTPIVDEIRDALGIKEETQFRITPEEDAAYAQAVEDGDMETAQEMVRKAAEESGYAVHGYHGTKEDFNVYEKGRKGTRFVVGLPYEVSNQGFFFAPNEAEAMSFARQDSKGDNTPTVKDSYIKMNNPLDLTTDDYEQKFKDVFGMYPMQWNSLEYTKDKLWQIADKEGTEYDIDVESALAKAGYDGIIFAESVDESGNATEISYFITDPNAVKSAEPATYDDNGNLIPLSQRFNQESDDIRYRVAQPEGTLATAGTYFSGGGLVEQGLKGLVDSKFAAEWDEKIRGVYAMNNGDHMIFGDVTKVTPEDIRKAVGGKFHVDFFHASPVCCRYSNLNTDESEMELDITTAKATADNLFYTAPDVFTLENVAGYKNSEALGIITRRLNTMGYTYDINVFDAADYGAATSRRRLILRAVKPGLTLPPLPAHTDKVGWYSEVEDLIDGLEDGAIPANIKEALDKSGVDYRTNENPIILFGQQFGKPRVAMADEPAPTITASGSGQDFVIMPNGQVKKVTPRMLARIMGLSDDYQLPESNALAHKVLGNGVPVKLTQAVIAPLIQKRILEREEYRKVTEATEKKYDELAQDYLVDFARGSETEKKLRKVFNKYVLENANEGITPFLFVNKYYQGKGVQANAHAIKDGKMGAIKSAASEMAMLVPENAVLVPMPGHNGEAGTMLTLAQEIAKITGSEVVDALKGLSRESRYEAKKRGHKSTIESLGFHKVAELPEGKQIVFIDNVVNTGVTAAAATRAMEGGITLAYAYSPNGTPVKGLKSAELVTYDDNGRVIPLKERFNYEKEDIRFSVKDDPWMRGWDEFDKEQEEKKKNPFSRFFLYDYTDEQIKRTYFGDFSRYYDQLMSNAESARMVVDEPEYEEFAKRQEELAKKVEEAIADYVTKYYIPESGRYTRESIEKAVSDLRRNASAWRETKYDSRTSSIVGPSRGKLIMAREYDRAADEIEKLMQDESYFKKSLAETKIRVGSGIVGNKYIADLFHTLNKDSEISALFEKVNAVAQTLPVEYQFTFKLKSANGNSCTDGVIKFNPEYFSSDYATDQDKASTLLHELIHQVTLYASWVYDGRYTRFKDVQLSQDMIDAITELREINYAIRKDKENFVKYNKKTGEGDYGTIDMEEMLAELSDPKFRAKLKKVNAWEKIKKALKKFFGIYDAQEGSALERIEKKLDYMLEHFDINAYNAALKESGAEWRIRKHLSPKEASVVPVVDADATMLDLANAAIAKRDEAKEDAADDLQANEGGTQFRVITDEKKVAELEAEPKVTVYRAMAVDKNGNLTAPMSSNGIKSKGKKKVNTETAQLGQWEESEEHKEVAVFNEGDEWAHVDIMDDAGGTTGVAYNPYIHTSLQMLNDQFAKAWRRPNMVVVECEVPYSEAYPGENAYKAEWAKNTVGKTAWTSGTVSSQFPEGKEREVILTRYAKPVRIVPVEEYAQHVKALLADRGMQNVGIPFNVVTPEQADALYKEGVKIIAPESRSKEKAVAAYEKWLKSHPTTPDGGGTRFSIVHHGSGAEFDMFDSSHMGEGEGHQAHGWGHYVSVSGDVAVGYAMRYGGRTTFTNDRGEEFPFGTLMTNAFFNDNIVKKVKKEGVNADLSKIVFGLQKTLQRNIANIDAKLEKLSSAEEEVQEQKEMTQTERLQLLFRGGIDVKSGRVLGKNEAEIRRLKSQKTSYARLLDELNGIIERANPNDYKLTYGHNYYDVDIPDNNGTNYIEEMDKPNEEQLRMVGRMLTDEQVCGIVDDLSWDKTETKQTPLAGFSKTGWQKILNRTMTFDDSQKEQFFIRWSKSMGIKTGKKLYNVVENFIEKDGRKTEKDLSMFLNKAGFVGIHYYGGRDGECYVVFNDNDLKITNNTRFRVTKAQDAEYAQAVESGDMEKAQEMVDKAAEAAGYFIRGFHGTTNRFYVFNYSKSNLESNWGRGHYFTNSEEDVNVNYASENGADLTGRIERLAEDMEFNPDYEDLSYEERMEEARKQLSDSEPRIISAALKANNPVIFNNSGRYRGLQETVFYADFETDEEGEVNYDVEPTGLLPDFIRALENEMENRSYIVEDFSELWNLAYEGGAGASEVEEIARRIVQDSYEEYDTGKFIGHDMIKEALRKVGFDAIIDYNVGQKFGSARKYGRGMAGVDNSTVHTIVFDSNQIKVTDPVTYDDNGKLIPLSERFNENNADIRFRIANENQSIFVSNAAAAVERIKQDKATPAQWLAMLTKEGGIKAGEDKWMGLSDWLKESTAKTLTKDEVMQFVKENAIQIEEVKYRGTEDDNWFIDLQMEYQYLYNFMEENGSDVPEEDAWYAMLDKYGDDFNFGFSTDGDQLIGNFDSEYFNWFAEQNGGSRAINETRLNYTTNGLTNKREIALVVPTIESWNESDNIHFGDAGEGRAIGWIRFGETKSFVGKKPYKEFFDSLVKKYGLDPYSSDEVDVRFASTEEEVDRLNELADAEYERVLVIDEIQSKRHQEGREKGYKPEGAVTYEQVKEASSKASNMQAELWKKERNSGIVTFEDRKAVDDAFTYVDELIRKYKEITGHIPDAPFDKNWMELCFKRMLRLAAEEGYDRVAWTSGMQQAERYDIGGTVSNISRSSKDENGERGARVYGMSGDQLAHIGYKDDGTITFCNEEKSYIGKNISDVFGRELAVRLLEDSPKHEFNGVDLEFGGEGMKAFYDQMLPSFVRKYTKKWGATVEDVTLPNLDEDGRVMHSVNITPEMKESVMQGQTMFRVGYHAGNLGKADDTYLGRMFGRSTGHFGTGTYFVGNESKLKLGEYNDRPQHSVDLDKYNLFKPKDAEEGYQLHRLLSDVDDNWLHEDDILSKQKQERIANILGVSAGQVVDALDEVKEQIRKPAERMGVSSAEFYEFAKNNDSAATVFMKALGFDGIDVRDIKELDNTDYGTVVYDLKDEDKQTMLRITDNLDPEQMTMREILLTASLKKAQEHQNSYTATMNALKDVTREFRTKIGIARAAAREQKALDKDTAASVTELVNLFITYGWLNSDSKGALKTAINAIKNAVGKEDIAPELDKMFEAVTKSNLKRMEKLFDRFLKVRTQKIDDSRVAKQGSVDLLAQYNLEAFRKTIETKGITAEMIEQKIFDKTEKLNEDGISQEMKDKLEEEISGLNTALVYINEVAPLVNEANELSEKLESDRNELADNADLTTEQKKYLRQEIQHLKDCLNENRMDQVEAYARVCDDLAWTIGEGQKRARDFREADKKRKEDIYHIANGAMLDRSAKGQQDRHPVRDWLSEMTGSKTMFKPLQSLNSMLKYLDRFYPDGQGKLYDYFMRRWVDAASNQQIGMEECTDALDAKAKEIFGVKHWCDINGIIRSLPFAVLEYRDFGSKQTEKRKMSQGQLAYIYSLSKMSDGMMKLNAMGIDEEKLDEIKDFLDPRVIQMMDWVQQDFLPSRRAKYNAVHERMFGAPMAAVDMYFPIRIAKNAVKAEFEVETGAKQEPRIGTKTGAIKRRTRNVSSIDLNADAFDVTMSNLMEMEKWAAFAEYARDVNTLMSYPRFRTQLSNMSSLYGSGQDMVKNLEQAFEMSMGYYQAEGGIGSTWMRHMAKAVAASKIAFRWYTALKQVLSRPAFYTESLDPNFAWHLMMTWDGYHSYKAIQWSYDNLPLFRKRWNSKKMGDTRLMSEKDDWAAVNERVKGDISFVGMLANSSVDAWTCACGAWAAYNAHLKKYKAFGMDEAAAEKRAKQDAEILYNESQQSSEGAFVSTVQMNKDFADVAISLYNNSSMGYQRRFIEHLNQLKNQALYKSTMIERMTSKYMADYGIGEEAARKYAEKQYRVNVGRNLLGVAIYGYGIQFVWRLASYMPYLIWGDDDEEKKRMLRKAAMGGCFSQPIRGTIFGKAAESAFDACYDGNWWELTSMLDITADTPYESDLKLIAQRFKNNRDAEAWVRLGSWATSIASGVDPQNFANMALAFYDAAQGDPDITQEGLLCFLRVINAPQSSIDQLYIDELGANAGELRKQLKAYEDAADEEKANQLYAQLAKRYVDYKSKYTTSFIPRGEEEQEKFNKSMEKKFKEKVNERAKSESFDDYAEGIKQLKSETADYKKRLGEMTPYELAVERGTERYRVYRSIIDPAGDGDKKGKDRFGEYDFTKDNPLRNENKPRVSTDYQPEDVERIKQLIEEWQQAKNL